MGDQKLSKRGQIYILAAILLAVAIYSLSTIVNVVQQEEIKGDFESLASNYEIESSKLINSVLQSGDVPVSEAFENFTFLFTSYSKAKSPSFNIFYALAYEDELHIGNFMDEDVTVYVPCPSENECTASEEVLLVGCLGNISAQMSFEGLTIQAGYLKGDFGDLRDKCLASRQIGDKKEYCLSIGGIVYNLSIDPGVPKIFSLSRLKSGAQVLNSIQGKIGQERVCEGRLEDDCCDEFCCWEKDACLEGRCLVPEARCGDGNCDPGEGCGCPADCPPCCVDGTRAERCSVTKPLYCNADGELIDDCNTCNCPIPGQQDCQADGSCCVKEGKSCDGSIPCCPGHYCDSDEKCKQFNELCEDGFDNDFDGDTDCKDSECEDYCSATLPKGCKGGALVDNCGECGCPSGQVCQADGSCIPTCSDGTLYGECSSDKPKYCENGYLVNKCSICGCPSGQVCQADDSCKELKKLRCISTSTYTKNCDLCVSDCDSESDCDKSCDPGDLYVSISKRASCGFLKLKEKCRIVCRDVYYTDCSVSPSCGSGYTQDGEPVAC